MLPYTALLAECGETEMSAFSGFWSRDQRDGFGGFGSPGQGGGPDIFRNSPQGAGRTAGQRGDLLWDQITPMLAGLGGLSPEEQARIDQSIQAYMALAGSGAQDSYSQALAGAAARGNMGGTYEAELGGEYQRNMIDAAHQASLYGMQAENQYANQYGQELSLLASMLAGQNANQLGWANNRAGLEAARMAADSAGGGFNWTSLIGPAVTLGSLFASGGTAAPVVAM